SCVLNVDEEEISAVWNHTWPLIVASDAQSVVRGIDSSIVRLETGVDAHEHRIPGRRDVSYKSVGNLVATGRHPHPERLCSSKKGGGLNREVLLGAVVAVIAGACQLSRRRAASEP